MPSKILEKAVYNQFYSFLEENKLLRDWKNDYYGSGKKRSTKLATTLFCDQIRNHVDNGKMVGSVYWDLSTAFGTISLSILDKLSFYGVQGSELAWFTDYLFSRT